MATLKDLIKTETLKVGSNASMPSGSRVQIKQGAHEGAWGEIARYVSPSDGYVQVTGASATTTSGVFRLDGDVGQTTVATVGGVTSFIPVRRGRTVILLGSYLKSFDMAFLKTIGGGYKRYLKALACNRFGGSLWLRLKTTSERTVSKSSTLGYRTTVAKLLSRKALLNTLHHLMEQRTSGISFLQTAQCQSKSLTAATTLYSLGILSRTWQGTPGGIRDLSGCLKGKSSTLKCSLGVQEHQKRQTFVFTLTSANNARMEVAA